jgi:hypothetical protein
VGSALHVNAAKSQLVEEKEGHPYAPR